MPINKIRIGDRMTGKVQYPKDFDHNPAAHIEDKLVQNYLEGLIANGEVDSIDSGDVLVRIDELGFASIYRLECSIDLYNKIDPKLYDSIVKVS